MSIRMSKETLGRNGEDGEGTIWGAARFKKQPLRTSAGRSTMGSSLEVGTVGRQCGLWVVGWGGGGQKQSSPRGGKQGGHLETRAVGQTGCAFRVLVLLCSCSCAPCAVVHRHCTGLGGAGTQEHACSHWLDGPAARCPGPWEAQAPGTWYARRCGDCGACEVGDPSAAATMRPSRASRRAREVS